MRTEATAKNINKLSHKDKVRFALFCAKQVEHLVTTQEAKECVRVVELWLDGKASVDDCRRAADAAYCAANYAANAADAAYCSAYYAANAYYAAYYTAVHAARADPNVKEACEKYLYELININNIIEQTLLMSEQ